MKQCKTKDELKFNRDKNCSSGETILYFTVYLDMSSLKIGKNYLKMSSLPLKPPMTFTQPDRKL